MRKAALLAIAGLALPSCKTERRSIRTYPLYFSEGFAPVMKEGNWGFIDKAGDYVVPPTFDYAFRF